MSNKMSEGEKEKIDEKMQELIRICQDIVKKREILYPDRVIAWYEIKKRVEVWLNVFGGNLGNPDLPIDLLKDLIDLRK